MGAGSAIEWTDHTFNPWWGCQKVSPGCQLCYAETLSNRFSKNIWGPPHASDRRLFGEKHWRDPVKWNAAAERAGVPARVFCASMADVFEPHPQVVDARARLWELIEATPWLTWLLLTKRPEYVTGMVPVLWTDHEWPANAWVGTSVEDQQRADERVPALLDVPAHVRFLSCEPLLGPVDLARWVPRAEIIGDDGLVHYRVPVNNPILTEQLPNLHRARPNTGYHARPEAQPDPYLHPGPFVDWVIVGGESGPGARPMHPGWACDLRDQCTAAGVPFHFKQWGAWAPDADVVEGRTVVVDPSDGQIRTWMHEPANSSAATVTNVGKKAAGRLLDGRTWDEFPSLVVDAEVLCCDLHMVEGEGDCCDPNDCGPCCEDCPRCPAVARMKSRAEVTS